MRSDPSCSAATPRPPSRIVWPCAAVFAATLIAYLPVLDAGFIWNDADYVTRPELRPLSGLRAIWFRLGATEQYYPALHSAFWIEHRLWGDAPLGYHLLNVILHAAAACLLALVVRELWRPKATAGWEWIAALLFALHPVCAESVAWVSEQKNTLSAALALLAALLYLRRNRPDPRAYLLATGCFALAVLSKSVTATVPPALLVLAWWRKGRISWRVDVAPLLPWFALAGAAGLVTARVEHGYVSGVPGDEFSLGLPARILIAGRAAVFYLAKLAWPHPLVFFYPRWAIDPFSPVQWLFPASVLAAVGALWLLRRRRRGPLAAALYFLGTLFPVLGFLNVYAFRFSFVADHFQYLAALGPLTALAAILPARLGRIPRPAYVAVPLCLLGASTFAQCRHYRDPETFYRAILARNPAAWIARNNLGNLLLQQNRTGEAIPQFAAALKLKPSYPDAETNLGVALDRQGRVDEAVGHFRKALALDPRSVPTRVDLGEALLRQGKKAEAAEALEQALRLDPANVPALGALAACLVDLGRTGEAIAFYERAIAARVRDPIVFNNLGGLQLAAGRNGAAAEAFRSALQINPGLPQAHEGLGLALGAQGDDRGAAEELGQAARLEPGNPQVRQEWAAARAGSRP
ncbi:MAG TPA: tetratricopeptide repeat protein [Opitutaceae bacterium]|nr:tetratricopeptide repeat protein [Opitutaceae bacterium]